MNRIAKTLSALSGFLLLTLLIGTMEAAEPFVPSQPQPLTERWRWTQIDALRERFFHCASVDREGNPWLAYNAGVVFYNGKETVEYHLPQDWKLPGRSKDIHAGSDGQIYLLHQEALAVLGKDRQWKKLLDTDEKGPPRNAITETANGTIWVGLNNGLYKVSDNRIHPTPCEFTSIKALIADDQDRLWCIGNKPLELGVYAIEEQTGDLELLRREPLGEFQEYGSLEIFKKPTGEIWALVSQESRYFAIELSGELSIKEIPLPEVYDERRFLHRFSSLSDGRFVFFQLPNMSIFDDGKWTTLNDEDYPLPTDGPRFFELSDQRLLLHGWQSRSFIIDLSTKRWLTYEDLIFGDDDADGRSWFMHRDKRVVSFDSRTGNWTAYDEQDGLISRPNSIHCDEQGVVWISGSHEGHAAVAYLQNGKWRRQLFPCTGFTLGHLSVCPLENGGMLFGDGTPYPTKRFSGKIVHFNPTTEGFEASSLTAPRDIQSSRSLVAHREHGLFLGGQFLYNKNPPNAPKFTRDKTFPGTHIDHLTIDDQGNLWAARWGAGLFRFDGEDWSLFTDGDGLTGLEAVYLLNGKIQKGLWAATHEGLSRFDGNSWTPHALNKSFVFSKMAGTLAESLEGELWLNFSHERWFLNRIQSSQGNKPMHHCVRYAQDDQAPETELIRSEDQLNEPANAFFSWTGLDPWSDTPKDELEYSYRLSNGAWSPYRRSTQASLLDLPAGRFTFEVRARDRDWNVDPTPASVSFQVIQPLWKRPWYIALLLALLLGFVAVIVIMIRQRVTHIVALRDFKIDFFTNLSHELRTPLTVILGPLERMLAQAEYTMDKKTLARMFRNASKLLALVNQLLEFRKVELGKVAYRPTQGELVSFVKDAVQSLSPMWEQKGHTVNVATDREAYLCGFDADMLDRIIDNLLSNAIKYTPEKGRISIDVRIEETDTIKLYLRITDNGLGIPAKRLKQVMDPFYQVPSPDNEEVGSGIGLSLVKELVKLWNGVIEINSPVPNEHKGTQVRLTLPLEKGIHGTIEERAGNADTATGIEEKEPQEPADCAKPTDRPNILLVEDNDDLSAYLEEELSGTFQVSRAKNGRIGLDTSLQNPPDLILSDIAMPEMDGIEFCRRIRENSSTCHIPLILLTAKSAETHYMEGIDSGADEYFTKPIQTQKLIHRIQNLLKSRRQLYDLFARQIEIEPKKIAVVSSDQAFLERALKFAEDNMQTESIDIETFARELSMSRRNLHRKVKAITGLTPLEFVRSMRLKRAAQLLISTDRNVSEIMPLCGFYEASSFSRSFKKEFGISPSEYRKAKRE